MKHDNAAWPLVPGLAGDGLAAPREVALVEAEGAVLLVAAAHRAELGHGGRPGELELPLGADGGALAAGGAALVPVVAGYTHGEAGSCNLRLLSQLRRIYIKLQHKI